MSLRTSPIRRRILVAALFVLVPSCAVSLPQEVRAEDAPSGLPPAYMPPGADSVAKIKITAVGPVPVDPSVPTRYPTTTLPSRQVNQPLVVTDSTPRALDKIPARPQFQLSPALAGPSVNPSSEKPVAIAIVPPLPEVPIGDTAVQRQSPLRIAQAPSTEFETQIPNPAPSYPPQEMEPTPAELPNRLVTDLQIPETNQRWERR